MWKSIHSVESFRGKEVRITPQHGPPNMASWKQRTDLQILVDLPDLKVFQWLEPYMKHAVVIWWKT